MPVSSGGGSSSGGSFSGGSFDGGSHDPTVSGRGCASGIVSSIGSIIAVVIVGFFGVSMIIEGMKPVSVDKAVPDYDNTVIIEDDLGVITNPEELMITMEDFRDRTGITPCVVTIRNRDWQGQHVENRDGVMTHVTYDDLSVYALHEYEERFEDESHWLIVYSQDSMDSTNWSWEGVKGTDTTSVLTGDRLHKFNVTLTGELRRKDHDVGASLIEAFSVYTTMNSIADKKLFYGGIAILVFLGFMMIMRIMVFISSRRYSRH